MKTGPVKESTASGQSENESETIGRLPFPVSERTADRFGQLKSRLKTTADQALSTLLDTYDQCSGEIRDMSTQLKMYRERELRALTIGDAISDGIYIINQTGTIIEVNAMFCKLAGVKAENIVGMNTQNLGEDYFLSKPVCTTVLEKGKKASRMCDMKKTGKRVLATGNPYFDEDGNITQVLVVIRDITELNRLREQLEEMERVNSKYLNELAYFRAKDSDRHQFIGQSREMDRIRELAHQISDVESTILITGETGVGKEVVAEYIFKVSSRRAAPFIKINCAAMPESLIESELFGYEKGAFTGARSKGKPGMFELANKGTILLDEIGDMPISLQPKLLRVLQEKEITRIGGTGSIKLDTRIIATTNQDLNDLIAAGKFRKDLFYRLNVISIKVPPLRERKEDIPPLIDAFLGEFNTKTGQSLTLDSQTLQAFQNYDYAGNIRELKNIVERLIVTSRGDTILAEDFYNIIGLNVVDPMMSKDISKLGLKEAVKQFEKQIVTQAIILHGSTHKAAKVLGVSQPTVLRKAKSAESRLA